jgi:hypothetical protein
VPATMGVIAVSFCCTWLFWAALLSNPKRTFPLARHTQTLSERRRSATN